MTEPMLPPAINGTDMRLDALIRRVERLCDLLTPAERPEPTDGDTIELREPAAEKPARQRANKAKRT
jgi:hypothetical protein